ncbi:MAG: hypothetical protein ACFCUR_07205 [Rhodomicrobiaceae bacterium]
MKLNLLRPKSLLGDGGSGMRQAAREQRIAKWIDTNCGEWSEQDISNRVLIAGKDGAIQHHALGVARALASREELTLLVDTSQSALAVSSLLGLPRSPGLAELCQGRAEFDGVIRRDPRGDCHFIGSGRPRAVGGPWGEPGAADSVFRALDEAYHWIVFCAEFDEAQGLADNMRRQFSAAVVVEDRQRQQDAFASIPLARHDFPILRLSDHSRD